MSVVDRNAAGRAGGGEYSALATASPSGRNQFPRAFVLVREEDLTGISGEGIVAGGVEFPDGTVVLRWYSDWPTSVVFHERGIESVEAVHGHGGKTKVVWQEVA